ncbi:myosin light chain kinase, smooth muscle-like [Dendronephthya gigantea]|uniref:myosin light chain kinase, smooth muscle-like n=1 Tax=Dendronephthya gigantea TaxID=151771 RepID=UPI00106A19EE|nr:myosin light chain kinase, smooth muscle-like [Dendronephthya gigantea]
MSRTEKELDLPQKYSSLQELYEKVLKEKEEALEETERATISFARHFDSEVSSLTGQILSLTKERDKAQIEAEDLGIKLANTKYELNRLQREHIKLQLEQEKYLDKIESFNERLKNEEKIDLSKRGKGTTPEEENMDKQKKDENLNSEGQLNHVPRPPVTIKKSKVDEDYTIHEELGRGKFGVVKRVVKQATQQEFAAKWVKVTSQTKEDVLKEIEIMGKLNHKRLVALYDVYDVSRNFVLIMEYITGGELFERIANEESVTEKECTYYMRQLLEGLQYMHKMSIVHLDLKPENIVCLSKDTWDIKLIDFGLAKELKPGKTIKTMQGTPEFVAPEVINFEPVCLASDMWSVGVIAYILISGLSPFLGDDDNETLSYVTAAEYDFEDEAFNEISSEAKDFIEKLLQKPPSKRKTADECLKHEWIKKNRGSNKIKTDNLKKFLAKRRWQKSVNAVRAVRRLSSMSSLFTAGAKAKSQSVVKLDDPQAVKQTPLAKTKRDFSKSMPSVFAAEGGGLNKRAMKILDSDTEVSQSESGSTETINTADVDDKDVLEGLFKENKDILDFLSSGLANNEQSKNLTKLRGISEEKDGNDDLTAKPDFVNALPATYTVPKGTPILMTCTVRGSPDPTVTWFRREKALTNEDTDVTIERDGDECSLAITQCEPQDEGSYSCVIKNQIGQATCKTNLDVQVSPDFVREMRDVSTEERKRVQFDVQISGKPLPTVEWYHGDTLLQEDRLVKTRKSTTDNNTFSLVIRSVTADRRGVYKCVLTNPLDSVSCSARLRIEGFEEEEEDEENEEEEEEEEEKEVEVLEEAPADENKDEVDIYDDHPRVSLRQDDINKYYDIRDEIGKGRFGIIYYAIHKTTGRDYAVKYIKVRKSQRDQFQHEIDIMNHLRHRRYIRLYEAFEESRKLILVLELMRGGELLERLSEKDYLTEHEIIRYVKQILEGVKDMHEKDVLHLDLKPQNIMFTTEDSNNLKLIDFGLARKLNAEKDLKILFGTPEFVAPEVVNYETITAATDMWSVGVITYILLTGVSPFWNHDPDVTLSNVTRAIWKIPEEFFEGVSEDAKDFLTKLLVKEPSKRMKVDEAFQHSWVKAAKQENTHLNHISTERLKKYYAHQKNI